MTRRRACLLCLGLGVLALIAALPALGGIDGTAFWSAWLSSFFYWLSMPLAAIALLMIGDLVGGDWVIALRPQLEAAAATLPFFILCFVPIAAGGLHLLYPWARPEVAATLPNTFYLNIPGYLIRGACYFMIWLVLGAFALRRSASAMLALDPDGSWLSGLGLALMALAAGFASIDWLMSLEPRWASTIFGILAGATQFLAGFAFLLLASRGGGDASRRNAYGQILLALVAFWTYLAFMQFLIIWEENLLDEIPWYLKRLDSGWFWVAAAIALGQFAIPFLTLIWEPLRRNQPVFAAICGMLLVTDLVYVWWMVMPEFADAGFTWIDPAIAIGLGGIWLGLFLGNIEWQWYRPLLGAHRAGVPIR